MKESEINEDDIDNIFLPAKCTRDSFTKVYVKFKSEESANLCLHLAKSLTNHDNKVSRYFPKPFSARLSALSHVAYKLRNEELPFKTTIEYTNDDIVLLVCPRGEYAYRQHCVDNLPPIDLTHIRSPPVGKKSKRPRSLSQSPTYQNTKKDRKKSPPKPVSSLGLEKDNTDDPVLPHSVLGAVQLADHDVIPEDDHCSVLPPVPLPAELGQISHVQAMSPITGKVVFDFASSHPSRRMSLNF